MSDKGKTLLRGHSLVSEGAPNFNTKGHYRTYGEPAHAKCTCGALSPEGQTANANKKWHRAHKEAARAAQRPWSAVTGLVSGPARGGDTQ